MHSGSRWLRGPWSISSILHSPLSDVVRAVHPHAPWSLHRRVDGRYDEIRGKYPPAGWALLSCGEPARNIAARSALRVHVELPGKLVAGPRSSMENTSMNEPVSPAAPSPGAGAEAPAVSLDVADARVGDALLSYIESSGALLSVKELPSGRYTYVNARMAALLGGSVPDLLGLTDADLMESRQAAPLRAAEQSAAAQRTPRVDVHCIERGGLRRDFQVFRVPLPAPQDGAPRYLLSVWSELTAQLQKDAQLQRALEQIEQFQRAAESARDEGPDGKLRDAETGLYQRGHFDDQLRREVDLSSREHREFALVSITLDPLDETVLAQGPGARASVLAALGRLLRSNTRAMDSSCRLEEDRFALLLSGVGLATAHARMEGLRRQCATQIVMLDGRELGFTVSMGVASFPHTAVSQDELLHACEAALAQARLRGGNHVTLASIRFEPIA